MFHPSIHINLKPVPHHHIRSYQKLLAREDTIATMENIMMKEYAATGLGVATMWRIMSVGVATIGAPPVHEVANPKLGLPSREIIIQKNIYGIP